ncbi:MAG TPA: multiprotein-bridging factor 1 family protein [Candidatus Norongarragalinales archaeon]|nr:multiprotein-bridging factor 1 family protein [Candidatus Norongarragalinales archaeon]
MKVPDCYICGKAAVTDAIVEGARVSVCADCTRYGKPIAQPPGVRRPVSTTSVKTFEPASVPIHHEYSVVEGFGKLISDARQGLHLTRRELANTLFISENVIERMEAGHLMPEHKVAQKLEKFLKIKLIEENIPGKVDKLKDELLSDYRGKGKGSYTVADAINIKVKKK